jgi:hypothetical protein
MAEHNKLNQEFYAYAGGLLNVSPQTAKKYWMGFVDTIIHILHFDGKCQMPSIGTFTLEELPERKVMAKNEQGELVEQINPAWFKILYKYNEDFLNNVNGRGVTKKYRRRVRERKLTPNDLKLITQAEMERTAKRTLKQMQDDRIEQAKQQSYDDFINVINKKKEDYERKKKEKEQKLNESTEDTTSD